MKQRRGIAEVAELAKVSPAVVSAVVNNRVGENIRVSQETQQRVWEAVKEIGYVPNPVARSLAKGKNNIIGIFTYEAIFPIQHQGFFYPFLVGIEEEAEAQNYDLLLYTSANQQGIRSVYQGHVNKLQLADGAIFLGLNANKQELARLAEENFPFVFIGRRELPGYDLCYVSTDYVSATAEIVSYIAGKGHRRIAYLRSTDDIEPYTDREVGYFLGIEQANLNNDNALLFRLEENELTVVQLQQWLSDQITAFVVENSDIGYALMNAGAAIGKYPPVDFSMAVLGQPLSPYENLPEWTSFRIPRREMGIEAVKLLNEILEAENSALPAPRLLPCTFLEGNTVGEPPAP